MLLVFDWHALLFGKENWTYLLQVVIKTIVMFFVVLVSLRLIGRRGIMQGIFPVLTIIMLGSSAGDPMLYSDVGLLRCTCVYHDRYSLQDSRHVYSKVFKAGKDYRRKGHSLY
jgi:hypothetical protein